MPQPKTALVLSPGGMFGAYHAGAFQTIRASIEPDLVVGTSVGALNGWPIAGGCTPEQLTARWLDPATGSALRLLPNAGFRNGFFDPAALRDQTRSLYRDFTPRIPFGVVVTRLEGFRACLIQYPDVTAEHLQATASIPICLPPVRIGGYRYLDGGLFEKLPIWAAVEMGATRIIAVDCLRVSDWWLRLGLASWRIFKRRRRLPPDLEVTLIAPEGPLGRGKDAVFWTRENSARWIDLGARDAAVALSKRL